MSLAPGEQRALTLIEKYLRCSDPRLEAMLATFTPPLRIRLAWRGERVARWRPGKHAIAAAVAVATIGAIVMAWVLATVPVQPACRAGPPGLRSIALARPAACRTASGHPTRAVTRDAGPASHRGARLAPGQVMVGRAGT